MLVEVLAVRPIARWRICEEIAGMNIDYKQYEGTIKKPADSTALYITKDDVINLPEKVQFDVLYSRAPNKALGLLFSLVSMGILSGFLIASMAFRHLVDFGDRLTQMSTMDKITGFLGLLVGLLLSANLLPMLLALFKMPSSTPVTGVMSIIVIYLSLVATMSMKEELSHYFPRLSQSSDMDANYQRPKILDTNVIIDGRITDICRTGFVEGQILVPSFVLDELQHIADSADSLRRARGRRGLDILNQLRNELGLVVKQFDAIDADNSEEVDARLVKLAKELDGDIVTNDFNLNKVAEIQGVTVLNINQLANALKPVVLPSEELTVSIVKEGKEYNQGVAFLDDGTMIVVEDARKHIGETIDVVVSSVLQTVAGKMIFANLKAIQEEEDELIDRNVRSYSSFRPRKKVR